VRKQLLGEQIKGPNVSSFKIFTNVIHQEGFLALYRGIDATLVRHFTYNSARIGSYPLIKKMIQGKESNTLSLTGKIFAASNCEFKI
jgi:hypothetical protein